jgi:hypothetical protein
MNQVTLTAQSSANSKPARMAGALIHGRLSE